LPSLILADLVAVEDRIQYHSEDKYNISANAKRDTIFARKSAPGWLGPQNLIKKPRNRLWAIAKLGDRKDRHATYYTIV
jgi:hypothetical protein